MLSYKDRLPGILVENAPQSNANTLRMDVPGMVGFTERGPLDTPIMIEDIQQYRAVFGGDVFLAHDKGVPVYAQLPHAVKAFFDNGGHRCYVVRVAGKNARPNYFRIPGLIECLPSEGLRTVKRPAASVGRWSDNVNIATRLRRQPLRIYQEWKSEILKVEPAKPDEFIEIKVVLPNAKSVLVNDLVSISLNNAAKSQIFMQVKATEQCDRGSYESAEWQGIPFLLKAKASRTIGFNSKFNLPLPSEIEHVEYGYFVHLENELHGSWNWYPLPLPRFADFEIDFGLDTTYNFEFFIHDDHFRHHQHTHWCLCEKRQGKTKYILPPLDITTNADTGESEQRDISKDILRLYFQNGLIVDFHINNAAIVVETHNKHLTLTCETFTLSREALHAVEILGEQGWQRLPSPITGLSYSPISRTQPYRLRFHDLQQLISPNDLLRLTFDGEHVFLFPISSHDWHYLENGQPEVVLAGMQLLAEESPATMDTSNVNRVELLKFDIYIREGINLLETWIDCCFGPTETNYWEDILARDAQNENLRTAKDILDEHRSQRLGPLAKHPPLDTGVDGSRPSPEGASTECVTPFYFPLNMLTNLPETLDYVVALPDDPWARGTKDGLEAFDPIDMFLDEDFYRSDPCQRLTSREIAILANQKLYFPDQEDTRVWKKPTKLHSLYEVDEVSLIAIPDLVNRCWGNRRKTTQIRREKTERCLNKGYFKPCPASDAKLPLIRQLPFQREQERRETLLREGEIVSSLFQRLETLPEVVPFEDECGCDDNQLVVVQRAMVNMCVARKDMMAILSLPQHFALHDLLDWHQQIVSPRDNGIINSYQEGKLDDGPGCIPYPRDSLDEKALSHVAVFHGWTIFREETTPEINSLRSVAPDGVILGQIASRTLQRGPGVAPANQPMQGVVGLYPEITNAEWVILFNRQINVLRRRPGQFTFLSNYTLSTNLISTKFSIRRLTIFIQKLVLYEGYRYVFESNTNRFRRAVQSRFERVFGRLLAQGSLTGYVVDATDRVNSPQDVEAGRLVVEIKYAPTHPVEYITIVLIRTSEGLLEVLEQ